MQATAGKHRDDTVTRHDSFISLLDSLELGGCTRKEYNDLKNEIGDQKELNLTSLVTLFAGSTWAADFIASLPIDIRVVKNLQTPSIGLIATDFVAYQYACTALRMAWIDDTLNRREKNSRGWDGVYSISFAVVPSRGGAFNVWRFPFGDSSPYQMSKTYYLEHTQPIRVIIEWPAYAIREVRGAYRGILRHGSEEYHVRNIYSSAGAVFKRGYSKVIGRWSMLHRQAPQYRLTFFDSKYPIDEYTYTIPIDENMLPIDGYTLPISTLLELFYTGDFGFVGRLNAFALPGRDTRLTHIEVFVLTFD